STLRFLVWDRRCARARLCSRCCCLESFRCLVFIFFFSCSGAHRDLHSFPTRRSSDLGVSGFQLHFSSHEVFTPGDAIDALIAMNPAALKVNVGDLKANGILIVNSDSFKESDLRKAQITVSPLEDHSLDKFRVFAVELQRLTRTALQHLGLDPKAMDRCKNFFA